MLTYPCAVKLMQLVLAAAGVRSECPVQCPSHLIDVSVSLAVVRSAASCRLRFQLPVWAWKTHASRTALRAAHTVCLLRSKRVRSGCSCLSRPASLSRQVQLWWCRCMTLECTT